MEYSISHILGKSNLQVFKTCIENSYDSIFITDIDKKIIYVNKAFI